MGINGEAEIMKYFELFSMMLESECAEDGDNFITSKKDIKLLYHTVEVECKKDTISGDDTYVITIKSNNDPNICGHVEYENAEDLKKVYNNLNTMAGIIDYMNNNYRQFKSAQGWGKIIIDEINANTLLKKGEPLDANTPMAFKLAKIEGSASNGGFGEVGGMGRSMEEPLSMGMETGNNEIGGGLPPPIEDTSTAPSSTGGLPPPKPEV